MNKEIEDFVQSKRIAVMGASRDPRKFGNAIVIELKQKGYEVFLVHPEAKEISGQTCYPSIACAQGSGGCSGDLHGASQSRAGLAGSCRRRIDQDLGEPGISITGSDCQSKRARIITRNGEMPLDVCCSC